MLAPTDTVLHWYISSDLAPDRYSVDPHVCDRLHRVRSSKFPVIKRPKPNQLRAQLSDLKRCVTSYPVVRDVVNASLTPGHSLGPGSSGDGRIVQRQAEDEGIVCGAECTCCLSQ